MIRPIQSPEETITRNASLRGRLRITGGDGEGEPKPVPAEVIIKTEEPKSESDSDSGDDKIRDYESKLDKEKADRIKLQAKLDEAQAKLNEKLAGDQTEAQQTAAERDQLKEKYEKLKEFMETGYLDTAILKEKKYDWHDVEAVRGVNSALRFRAQAPLVDQLLREIGIEGGDIQRLVGGSSGASAALPPASPKAKE